MDHEGDVMAVPPEDLVDGRAVPDVGIHVAIPVTPSRSRKSLPESGRLLPEEMRGMSLSIPTTSRPRPAKNRAAARADQARGPGNHGHTHRLPPHGPSAGDHRDIGGPAHSCAPAPLRQEGFLIPSTSTFEFFSGSNGSHTQSQ